MELKNRLSESESPYLREAAGQPVHWQIYSEEVFRMAKDLDRPILLDIGAVWCHWCHVMDGESYSDPAVAEVVNRLFVPIKVDRDQMPDVDARYQAAIGALTGAGGWPLTGFLTPDGRAFYGGTYFPKDDLQDRPGFLSLLPQISEAYARKREDVLKSAEEIESYLREFETRTTKPGVLDQKIADIVVQSILEKIDAKFGGFGSAPKFFNPTALLLLADEAAKPEGREARKVLELTLDRIAEGGVYDQIGGGFHRYSVDRYWHVPHFEKMLYDNALMLTAYLKAHEVTKSPLYHHIAAETAGWMMGVMRSSDGPFFAHQDADVGAHDDGSYWTWSAAEVRSMLTEKEFAVIADYFDIRKEPNDTRELPDRNVLRIAVSTAEIAKNLQESEDEVLKVLSSARLKLRAARDARKPPFIDRTYFVDRNGLAISSLVEASVVLKEKSYLEAAEKAAAFILDRATDERGKIAHAFAGMSVVYDGLLDDHVYFGLSLLDLFDVMRNDEHLDGAEKIARVLLDDFEDKKAGGFFDRPVDSEGPGLLSVRKKPIDDTPTPSGNSGAAAFFDRLFTVTENGEYYRAAERTLAAFAGSVAELGIYFASYARALKQHLALRKNLK